jgi:predicted negative regulator of RcsB-dependent stress response
VSRITRKELKSDKFALAVEHTVPFFEEHQQEIIRYGAIALAAVALIVGYWVYRNHQHAAREEALAQAIRVQEAPAGGISGNGGLAFPTQEAKDVEATRVFTDLQAKYPGSSEGQIAQYYLSCIKADQGKMAEAEKGFQQVAQNGDTQYASLAKLSLAQIYFSDGRNTQAEAMLRDLMAHPTPFVSKDQATLMLARYMAIKNPAEARKLLDPLRTVPGTVGQVALTMYGELPPTK